MALMRSPVYSITYDGRESIEPRKRRGREFRTAEPPYDRRLRGLFWDREWLLSLVGYGVHIQPGDDAFKPGFRRGITRQNQRIVSGNHVPRRFRQLAHGVE